MQDVFHTIGEILIGLGLIGIAFLADTMAGVTRSMRMGRDYYPKERKIRKWVYTLLFLIMVVIGALMYFVFSKI